MPLWWALERLRGRGWPRAAGAGLVFGGVAYAGGHPWLWRLVEVFLAGDLVLGAALWLAYGLWFAAAFGIYALAFVVARRRGAPVALAGVAPWILLEWLYPLLFPVRAGSGLASVTALVQIADLGGELGLSVLVVLVNVALFETGSWWRGRRPRPMAVWVLAAGSLAFSLGYGQWRTLQITRQLEGAPVLRIGLVQANLGLVEKRSRVLTGHRQHLEQTRELLAAGPLDLVVWPETAYARALRGPLPVSGQLVRQDIDVPLLFGGTLLADEGAGLVQTNSAFLVAADGLIHDVYRKNLLIPLAEWVPLARFVPGLAERLPHAQGFAAAKEVPPLGLGPWRIATPICYEAIRPDLVRRMFSEGQPHLLVTLANDAWFGDSQEPWLHLQLARLRAVEHRRSLVRATNSGISAVVDPLGRISAQTGLMKRENLRAEVPLLGGRTLYARLGDWPGWLAAAALAAGLIRRRLRPAD